MKCSVAKQLMSSYLDAAVTRDEFSAVQEHLQACAGCSARYFSLQQTQRLVGSLGRKAAPSDLTLRLRVALSNQIAGRQRSRWEMARVRWENAFNAIMVPATAGLVTTVITFGLLISFLVPTQIARADDVPTMLYTPPELRFSPFELVPGTGNGDALIVEAYVGADGRIEDYRILSGAENATAVLAGLKNTLLFTTFRPATSFGRPTAGRAILSFSKIQVKG